jgi:8-amino-7-oxononanoate synthase
MFEAHERALAALAARGRLRALAPRAGADFTSNDYLGLAASGALTRVARAALERGVPVGAGGSRLLRGNDPEHEALEAEAAAVFGAESALFFGGGFMANFALFSTLPDRGDLVVHDELIHASVHDGLRAGRAERASARHNDPQAFEDAIVAWRRRGGAGRPWIAVESLYSMDGDRAPLDELAAIADRHEGVLVIDEAHATGVYGPDGRGLGAHLEGRRNVLSLHTCGKALGAMGALVLGPRLVRDVLVNRARPFIYATAPSPLIAAVVRAALKICRDQPERRERLHRLVALAGRELEARCGFVPSGTQIQPVIVGADDRATRLAAAMRAQGFDLRAVRPPTVPEGTARLRVSITLNVDEDIVRAMAETLARELERLDRASV